MRVYYSLRIAAHRAGSYRALGDLHQADIELEKFKALDGPGASAFQYAEIYAQRGDKPSVLHWLASAEAPANLR